MPTLFSYGSLRDPAVQRRTFGREIASRPDALPRFSPARAGAHANALHTGNPSDSVEGVALDVTDAELAAADEYERPSGYFRIAVTLASGIEAWVYVFRGVEP